MGALAYGSAWKELSLDLEEEPDAVVLPFAAHALDHPEDDHDSRPWIPAVVLETTPAVSFESRDAAQAAADTGLVVDAGCGGFRGIW